MTPCKSCGTVARTHKLWCMRPAPVLYQPRTVHEVRAAFQVACA